MPYRWIDLFIHSMSGDDHRDADADGYGLNSVDYAQAYQVVLGNLISQRGMFADNAILAGDNHDMDFQSSIW